MPDPKFQDLSDQIAQPETRVDNLQEKLVRTVNGGEAIRERLATILDDEFAQKGFWLDSAEIARIVEALLAELRRS